MSNEEFAARLPLLDPWWWLYNSTATTRGDTTTTEDTTSSRKKARYLSQSATTCTTHGLAAASGQGFVLPTRTKQAFSVAAAAHNIELIESLPATSAETALSQLRAMMLLEQQLASPPFKPEVSATSPSRMPHHNNNVPVIPANPLPPAVDQLRVQEAMMRASIQKKRHLYHGPPHPIFQDEPPLPILSKHGRESVLQLTTTVARQNVHDDSPLAIISPRMALQLTNTAAGQNVQEGIVKPMKGEARAPLFHPVLLSCPHDSLFLSEHQTFLRTHVEVFAATVHDIDVPIKGRNTKRLRVGQIGVRCRHCAHVAMKHRSKGSTYFPASTMGVYQATQNMCAMHLQCGLCPEMTDATRDLFSYYLARKTTAGSSAGRAYWTQQAKLLGLVDTDAGIFPMNSVPLGVNPLSPDQMKHYASKRKSNFTSS